VLGAFANLTAAQLKRALAIKERIEKLERELDLVIRQGVTASTVSPFRKRRKVSAASRAKIAAAARARWARFRAAKAK